MAAKEKFVFGKNNIYIILAGIAVTLLGFVLMIGGGSEDPNVFNADELFSSVRITIAPFLVIAGYAVVIYGIMKKPNVQV
ncbi:MAG: DUF3098 domain-containing protein [Crocinitomicaceae bacterium]|nr:DUF3098 domain-containing protein [Crocinitomicaceae bacterium]MBK8927435.1 DUF3098 domain-containing protein [Crocinitomicaceae bacterium]